MKSGPKRYRIISSVLWWLLGLTLIFLAQNRHSRADRFNYHSEIWSDKAGYHIYLAGFEYQWNGHALRSKGIIDKTGHGFDIDSVSGKFLTKYTYGTALAISPFYLIGRMFESPDEAFPGFSVTQNRMISLAAACWLGLGLWFLYQFLGYYTKRSIRIMVVLLLLLGTNLLYYGVQETGMSHVYSFTLFTLLLYILKRTEYLAEASFFKLFWVGALAGWIVVLRQSNLLFLPIVFLLDTQSVHQLKERITALLKPTNILPLALGFFLLLLPQFIYWKYAHNQLFTYSYGEEGFIWSNPRLLKVWFSPYNGLFLYAPVLLVVPVSAFFMAWKRKINGAIILLYFLGLSYLFSCWWEWNFGCAFGARSFTEYLSLFSLALVYALEKVENLQPRARYFIYGMLLLSCFYTFKMTFSVEGCFPGTKDWDWPVYVKELTKPMR